ncbi:MAG TPA: hypothetical protein VK745_12585 [Polyangiaceae bacterium]|nr:hypothetical protein [Polyangiaceae bacterium]
MSPARQSRALEQEAALALPCGFALLALALGATRAAPELGAKLGAPSLLAPVALPELCNANTPCPATAGDALDTSDALETESSPGSAREHANAQHVSAPMIDRLGNALVFISKPNQS